MNFINLDFFLQLLLVLGQCSGVLGQLLLQLGYIQAPE